MPVEEQGSAGGEPGEPRDGEEESCDSENVISHHAQTLQLLDVTFDRDNLDPQIGTLADETRESRFDEAATAQEWLKTWGKRIPKTVLAHDNDQDGVSYDTSIPGVLTSGELHRLERAKGAAFTQAWLRKLIAHEQGAVKLAADAIEDGQNADVVAFAQKDEKAHQQQVARLERLLAS